MSDTGRSREPRPASAATEFWAGCTDSSLSSLVGAIVFCLCLVAAAASHVTPEYVSRVDWSAAEDDYGEVTSRILHATNADSPQLSLSVLSASAVRDCIADSREICDELSVAWGQETEFGHYCVGNLSLWEVLAVSDMIADHVRGLVIIEVAPHKFCRTHEELVYRSEHPRLGFRSPCLESLMRSRGIEFAQPSGCYLFDNTEFLAARRHTVVRSLLVNRVSPQLHLINRRHRKFDENEMDRRLRKFTSRLVDFGKNREGLFECIERAAARFAENGQTKVVLLESPFNPLAREEMNSEEGCREVLADYSQWIDRSAKRIGIEYWNFESEIDFEVEEFADEFHLAKHASRIKYTDVLLDRIKQLDRPAAQD